MYSDIFHSLFEYRKQKGWCGAEITNWEKMIQDLKSFTVKMLGPHCDSGLHTMKLNFLNHLEDDFRKFGNMSFIDASDFEQINVVAKRSYCSTYRRIVKMIQETVYITATTISQI